MFERALNLHPALSARGQRNHPVRHPDRFLNSLARQVYGPALVGHSPGRTGELTPGGALYDFLLASSDEPNLPDEVFVRLRWGGVFIYAGDSEARTSRLAETYAGRRGFIVEQPVTRRRTGPLGLPIPGLSRSAWWFAARKVHLIQPGQITERFTYNVRLVPNANAEDGYIVTKSVPTAEQVLWRLRHRYPEADQQDLEKRAGKLVDHVFPTFLTREAAILQILQEKLPEPYRKKVPHVLGVEKDSQGFVRQLAMNWLRTRGKPISQIAFARQSAELLDVLHEQAGVIHLDLRLDNFVLTDGGVAFVDFGSAVRVGEELDRSAMLSTLFGEMMRTSQIQRMLGRMLERGQVTNSAMRAVQGKVDPAVDIFYLAVQINRPLRNPEFRDLIEYDPDSREARMLEALTAAILRPKDPKQALYATAGDILRGIRKIEAKLATPHP